MARWVYQAGNSWTPFDDRNNLLIEQLWRAQSHGNIYIGTYRAYINTTELYMVLNAYLSEEPVSNCIQH